MPASDWQRSSYCGEGDACLNVAADASGVRLTESSDPDGVILHTTPAAFAAFTHAVKTDSPSPTIVVTHTPGSLVRLREPRTAGTTVTTTRDKWDAFVLGVRAGEFDHFTQAR